MIDFTTTRLLIEVVDQIDYCKPKATEVAKEIALDIAVYLKENDSLKYYQVLAIGFALGNIEAREMENSTPNCDDCSHARFHLNRGGSMY